PSEWRNMFALGRAAEEKAAAVEDDYDEKNTGGSLTRVAVHDRGSWPLATRSSCGRAGLWTRGRRAEVPGGPRLAQAPEQLGPWRGVIGRGRSTRSRVGAATSPDRPGGATGQGGAAITGVRYRGKLHPE